MKTINLVAAVPYHRQYLPYDFIGVDKGAGYLLANNIKMLFAIGDFDSLNQEDFNKLNELDVKIVKLATHKDETDLEYAIQYLQALGYDYFNVYGAIGQRIDHSITNMNLLKKYPCISLYDDYSKVFILSAGEHSIIDNEYKYYSFYAIEECSITLTNFVYPLDDYLLKLDDTLCISNELKIGAKIIVDKDIIVVASL